MFIVKITIRKLEQVIKVKQQKLALYATMSHDNEKSYTSVITRRIYHNHLFRSCDMIMTKSSLCAWLKSIKISIKKPKILSCQHSNKGILILALHFLGKIIKKVTYFYKNL